MVEKYKNPALTVDIVVFSIIKNTLKLLLIKRKNPPFQDKWAIPGGFADYDEGILAAAGRELEEETGINNAGLEQVQTFGKPGRDPRGRTVSVVYYALIDSSGLTIKADTDAKEAKWFNVNTLPELAFDHAEILDFTTEFLRQKLENTPVVRSVLPDEFSIDKLQEVYEVILDKKFGAEEFEQKIKETGLLETTENSLYKFRKNVNFTGKFI